MSSHIMMINHLEFERDHRGCRVSGELPRHAAQAEGRLLSYDIIRHEYLIELPGVIDGRKFKAKVQADSVVCIEHRHDDAITSCPKKQAFATKKPEDRFPHKCPCGCGVRAYVGAYAVEYPPHLRCMGKWATMPLFGRKP